MATSANKMISSGVDALIGQLRDQGVTAGRQEAERLVEEARQQAARILHEAKSEAETVRRSAEEAIAAERADGQVALELAARDTMLALKSQLEGRFREMLLQLVSAKLEDPTFLERLLVAIAGRALPDDAGAPEALHLPESFFKSGALESGEPTANDPLDRLTATISTEMLRQGVELRPGRGLTAGVRVRLLGSDLEVDLSNEALTQLLLRHLMPRFRTRLEGLDR